MDVLLRSMLTERRKNKYSVVSFSSICFFCYKALHLSQCLVHRYLRVKGFYSPVLHLNRTYGKASYTAAPCVYSVSVESLVDNFCTIIGKLLFNKAKLTFYRL